MSIRFLASALPALRTPKPAEPKERREVFLIRQLAQSLVKARAALQVGHVDSAEAILRNHGSAARSSCECLNVLGLIAESRGRWREARKCWRRAIHLDKRYHPARQNLRRYFEMFQFGRTTQPIAYGDEPRVCWTEECS